MKCLTSDEWSSHCCGWSAIWDLMRALSKCSSLECSVLTVMSSMTRCTSWSFWVDSIALSAWRTTWAWTSLLSSSCLTWATVMLWIDFATDAAVSLTAAEAEVCCDAAILEMKIATEADNEVDNWCNTWARADDSAEFETAVRQGDWDDERLNDRKRMTMKTHIAKRTLNRKNVHKEWCRSDSLDCRDWFLLWPVFSFDLWFSWWLSKPDWHSQTRLWFAWLSWPSQWWTDSTALWSAWETRWSLWMTTICKSLTHSDRKHSWHLNLLLSIESAFESVHLHQNDLTHRSLDEEVVGKPYESWLMLIWIAESWSPDDSESLRNGSDRPDLDADCKLDDIVMLVADLNNELLWLL